MQTVLSLQERVLRNQEGVKTVYPLLHSDLQSERSVHPHLQPYDKRLQIFPGQGVSEFLLDDEEYSDMRNRINNTYPDRVQLGSILSTPDEPELDVLTETLGDIQCGYTAT
jgi:hypothetical protein